MNYKLVKNRKGVSPTVSSILMIVVTVAAMIPVISFSTNTINQYNGQMGEKVVIEKVLFNSTDQIEFYIRNIGHGELTLTQYKIGSVIYDLLPTVHLLEQQGNFVIIKGVFTEDVYPVAFYSSRNNELGAMEVIRS